MPPKDSGPLMPSVTTEEEWAKICGDNAEKDVLYFVEVFAAWCGPTDAVISTFRKLKMDYEGRKLKFAQARVPPGHLSAPVPTAVLRHSHRRRCLQTQICADVTEYLVKYREGARPIFLFFKEGAPARHALL